MIDVAKFQRFNIIRRSGKYNMMSISAIAATGLSLVEYTEIINNFSKYLEMFGDI